MASTSAILAFFNAKNSFHDKGREAKRQRHSRTCIAPFFKHCSSCKMPSPFRASISTLMNVPPSKQRGIKSNKDERDTVQTLHFLSASTSFQADVQESRERDLAMIFLQRAFPHYFLVETIRHNKRTFLICALEGKEKPAKFRSPRTDDVLEQLDFELRGKSTTPLAERRVSREHVRPFKSLLEAI